MRVRFLSMTSYKLLVLLALLSGGLLYLLYAGADPAPPPLSEAEVVDAPAGVPAQFADSAVPAGEATLVGFDSRFTRIVPDASVVQRVVEVDGYAAAPLWLAGSDRLLYVDVDANALMAVNAQGAAEVVRTPLWASERGPAGFGLSLARSWDGSVLFASGPDGRVVLLSLDGGSAADRVLADQAPGGLPLAPPRDVAVAPDGAVWFTASPEGLVQSASPGDDVASLGGVFRIGPDGALDRFASGITAPAGLAFSPDGSEVVVADGRTPAGSWHRFPVSLMTDAGGGSPALVASDSYPELAGAVRGVVTDFAGNIFAVSSGGVAIFESSGTPLGMVLFPGYEISSLAWGRHGRSLFLAGRGGVWELELPFSGGYRGGLPRLRFELAEGSFTVELRPDRAPVTAANFLRYVHDGFYDGTVFHRVIAGFIVQAGRQRADGVVREPRAAIVDEAPNGLVNDRGSVAMARHAAPHSATSEWFVNLADNSRHGLDGDPENPEAPAYTVFGRVVEGMEIVDRIAGAGVRQEAGSEWLPIIAQVVNRVEVVP